MSDVLLIVNSGSTSLKFGAYPATGDLSRPIVSGKVSGIGNRPVLTARDDFGFIDPTGDLADIPADATHEWLAAQLLERLRSRFAHLNPVGAGHRVVHGGRVFLGPVRVDEAVRAKLESLVPLAPLHQPHNLAAIDALAKAVPGLPQVACFDTTFHRTQPRLATLFALPRRFTDEGIVRYGFHGLSYEFMATTLPEVLGPQSCDRVIVAHLGNGASMCAMRGLKSVATSMGFTALDGLMMGRRCGALDAGVVLHLLQRKRLTPKRVEHMLYRESGLLGVSGISNDMRELEQSPDPAAREAIELFCYRAAREIGALAATLGGLDALIFTAGIGENSALVRSLICERSAWLGVEIDQEANLAGARKISSPESSIEVRVIPTNEEAVIAAATRKLIGAERVAKTQESGHRGAGSRELR